MERNARGRPSIVGSCCEEIRWGVEGGGYGGGNSSLLFVFLSRKGSERNFSEIINRGQATDGKGQSRKLGIIRYSPPVVRCV